MNIWYFYHWKPMLNIHCGNRICLEKYKIVKWIDCQVKINQDRRYRASPLQFWMPMVSNGGYMDKKNESCDFSLLFHIKICLHLSLHYQPARYPYMTSLIYTPTWSACNVPSHLWAPKYIQLYICSDSIVSAGGKSSELQQPRPGCCSSSGSAVQSRQRAVVSATQVLMM
jgi:hypothetical protein